MTNAMVTDAARRLREAVDGAYVVGNEFECELIGKDELQEATADLLDELRRLNLIPAVL
jgi:hypothetical protein